MNRGHFRRRAFACALSLLIAGCASVSPPAGDQGISTDSDAAATRHLHDTIDLAGRLSVRYQSGDKEEALHGSFSWNQTPEQTAVTLLSPLGQTIAIIEVTPAVATMKQSGKMERTAADVDALTADTLGWPLPVAGLREWLQGYAIDHNGRRFVASPATDEVITHDGWRIRYVNWQDNTALPAQYRPKRIDLARFTEQAGDVAIRIIIDTWQVR